MLTNLALLPVLFILALGIGIVLNAALRRKRIQWLPERRPWFCVLPKYCMNLELTGPENICAAAHHPHRVYARRGEC